MLAFQSAWIGMADEHFNVSCVPLQESYTVHASVMYRSSCKHQIFKSALVSWTALQSILGRYHWCFVAKEPLFGPADSMKVIPHAGCATIFTPGSSGDDPQLKPLLQHPNIFGALQLSCVQIPPR
jgi:hypothetical protein